MTLMVLMMMMKAVTGSFDLESGVGVCGNKISKNTRRQRDQHSLTLRNCTVCKQPHATLVFSLTNHTLDCLPLTAPQITIKHIECTSIHTDIVDIQNVLYGSSSRASCRGSWMDREC